MPFLTRKQQEDLQYWTNIDQGDCADIARAFKKLFGAELFMIRSTSNSPTDLFGHMFVWYKGKFYDGYGEVDPDKLLEYYTRKSGGQGAYIIKVTDSTACRWSQGGYKMILDVLQQLKTEEELKNIWRGWK